MATQAVVNSAPAAAVAAPAPPSKPSDKDEKLPAVVVPPVNTNPRVADAQATIDAKRARDAAEQAAIKARARADADKTDDDSPESEVDEAPRKKSKKQPKKRADDGDNAEAAEAILARDRKASKEGTGLTKRMFRGTKVTHVTNAQRDGAIREIAEKQLGVTRGEKLSADDRWTAEQFYEECKNLQQTPVFKRAAIRRIIKEIMEDCAHPDPKQRVTRIETDAVDETMFALEQLGIVQFENAKHVRDAGNTKTLMPRHMKASMAVQSSVGINLTWLKHFATTCATLTNVNRSTQPGQRERAVWKSVAASHFSEKRAADEKREAKKERKAERDAEKETVAEAMRFYAAAQAAPANRKAASAAPAPVFRPPTASASASASASGSGSGSSGVRAALAHAKAVEANAASVKAVEPAVIAIDVEDEPTSAAVVSAPAVAVAAELPAAPVVPVVVAAPASPASVPAPSAVVSMETDTVAVATVTTVPVAVVSTTVPQVPNSSAPAAPVADAVPAPADASATAAAEPAANPKVGQKRKRIPKKTDALVDPEEAARIRASNQQYEAYKATAAVRRSDRVRKPANK